MYAGDFSKISMFFLFLVSRAALISLIVLLDSRYYNSSRALESHRVTDYSSTKSNHTTILRINLTTMLAINSAYEDIGARITSNNKAHLIRAGQIRPLSRFDSRFFGAGVHLNVTASIWNI